jgi:hypothetical protein
MADKDKNSNKFATCKLTTDQYAIIQFSQGDKLQNRLKTKMLGEQAKTIGC